MVILIPLVCFAFFCLLWPVFVEESEEEKAHRKQQAALRRHRRQQDKEEKRVRKLWKERGKVIRPLVSRNLRKSNPWF